MSASIPFSRRMAHRFAPRDTIDDMLEFATLMLNAQACIIDLVPQLGAVDGIIRSYQMAIPDAKLLLIWLRRQLDRSPSDGCTAIPIPSERWPDTVTRLGAPNDGEAVALRLTDTAGALGWIIFLGLAGMLNRAPLLHQRTRTAFIGQIRTQTRSLVATRSLQERHDQMENIFRFSGDGILTVDAAMRITGCNPALEQLIVRKSATIQGKPYHEILQPEDHSGNLLTSETCPLGEAFSTDAHSISREMIIHARDGQPIEVAVTASVVRSPEGIAISGVLNVRDIGRSKEHEMLSSTIVSVVSHELQTPISIIKGYASTLSRTDVTFTPEALRRRLHAIEEESDRLSHMVANLLYASRINAGGLTMNSGPVMITSLVSSCVRRFRARGIRHKIQLHLPEDIPVVEADAERIEEVIANLIDNASKYSKPGTTIVVTGNYTNDQVIVSVTDSGDGIPLREQQRVFDRFQRVDGEMTSKTSGAGLGLYICKAIVNAHGGQIWVESEIGHGSTFSFSIPRLQQGNAPVVRLPQT